MKKLMGSAQCSGGGAPFDGVQQVGYPESHSMPESSTCRVGHLTRADGNGNLNQHRLQLPRRGCFHRAMEEGQSQIGPKQSLVHTYLHLRYCKAVLTHSLPLALSLPSSSADLILSLCATANFILFSASSASLG